MRSKVLLVAAALSTACQPEPTAPAASADASSQVAAASAAYTVINLGHLGDEANSEPAAIHDAGQVVGNSISSIAPARGTIGVITEVGPGYGVGINQSDG